MRDPNYQNNKKSGCTFKVKNNFDNITFYSDTVDKNDFKSISLRFEGWFVPNTEYKPKRKIEKLCEQIKNTINLNSNKYYFSERIIDLVLSPETFNDIRSGFCTFEYTIFVNRGVRFNKNEVTTVLNELIDIIYSNYFENPVDFDIYKNRMEFRKRPLIWNPDDYYPGDETPENERL